MAIGYTKNWVPSPNFTPGNQTQAAYGRPRSIQGGAGHWWNWPRSGATHDGIVNYMANAARQAAPHAVLSDRRVTEMVRDWDTAWCTSNANPYTFAIEIDPRIMFKWGYDNPSAAERALGERIFETLCEYIADKGYHNLPWKPHNVWAPGTQCNPIHYDEVMARAKQIWNEKRAPANPSVPVPAAKKLSEGTIRMTARLDKVEVWDLTTNPNYKSVKTLRKGETIDVVAYIDFNNTRYYVTQYSYENGKKVGVNRNDVIIPEPDPEWIRNLKNITPVKLMVLPASGTNIINLNDGKVIAPLGKGTYVDFVKSTIVGGKEYLISKYSADRSMPNGILRSDVGVPAEPPKQEKPSWLDEWEDIENKTMYTRVEAPLVDLLTGKTIKTIPINTPIEVGSTTEWLDAQYAISEYSTKKKEPRGILIVHLDDKPIEAPKDPVEPAPQQPTLEERVSLLEKIVADLKKRLGIQ